jgi:CBS domain containing-hemolysin-like protein
LLSLEDVLGRPTPDLGVNSVGGLVQEQLGRLPRPGERVRFPHFEVEVLQMAGPRIELVRVPPLEATIMNEDQASPFERPANGGLNCFLGGP